MTVWVPDLALASGIAYFRQVRDLNPVRRPAQGLESRTTSCAIHGRIDSLAHVGAINNTRGCSGSLYRRRPATSRPGRRMVRELGLEECIHGVGNVIATMPWLDRSAPVMTGSNGIGSRSGRMRLVRT